MLTPMKDSIPTRAVALMSGGLDSVLAVKIILDQGVDVIGLSFAGGYCPVPRGEKSRAQRAGEQLGIEVVTLPIDQRFIDMVRAPRYGHGRNMNPCIDCHTMMVRRAWEWGESRGTALVLTGEVLGQRPMSQTKQGLMLVAKRSGVDGRLLRPLSAKLLEPTVPERAGLIDRERLLDIQGRTRRRQFGLAEQYGITEFGTPAGGCLLTDKGFARRLREAFDHGETGIEMVELLRFGRHFRLPSGVRVVVGRDKGENEELLARVPEGAAVADGSDLPGPVALLIPDRVGDREDAARICARYSDRKCELEVRLQVGDEWFAVKPASSEETSRLVIE